MKLAEREVFLSGLLFCLYCLFFFFYISFFLLLFIPVFSEWELLLAVLDVKVDHL